MPETRIHDYRQRCWGHDYILTPDPDPVTARIVGWGEGLRQGDLLVIPRSAGDGSCLYEIEQIEYKGNPSDMWSSRCRFVPGSSDPGQKAAAAMDRPRTFSPVGLAFWVVFDA